MELWKRRLGWSREDDAQLDQWRAAREPYRGRTLLEEEGTGPDGDSAWPSPALPLPVPVLNFDSKIRIAGLQARSPEDYRTRLSLLLYPLHASRLAKVVSHFQPRFGRWWRAVQETQKQATRSAARAVARRGFRELIARVARLYEAGWEPDRTVHAHFIARPYGGTPLTIGEHLEEHILVERSTDRPVSDDLDVVSHELFHCFFASAPVSRQAQLIANFVCATDPFALHAYHLLDEAFATALANGLVHRWLHPAGFEAFAATPYSFYSDVEIDQTAKALLPLVEDLLARGSSLFEVPTQEIIRCFHNALGASLERPAIGLRSHVVVFDAPGLASVRDHLVAGTRARASYAFSWHDDEDACRMLQRHTGLGGVLLLGPKELPRLEVERWNRVLEGRAGAAALRQPLGDSFLYGVRRSDKAYVYVVVAGDAAESRRLVDVLLDSTTPFDGLAPHAV